MKSYDNPPFPYQFACIEWIRAEKEKPPHSKRVLLCDFTEWMYVGFYNEDTKQFENSSGEEPGVTITHWARLPNAPDGV